MAHVQKDGTELYLGRTLRRATQAGPAFVSFDVDACAKAFTPAAAAPRADGFTPRQAAEAAFLTGKDRQVRLSEVVKLNPLFDRDDQTTRLAATSITAFPTDVSAK